jgi:hypothetical protein
MPGPRVGIVCSHGWALALAWVGVGVRVGGCWRSRGWALALAFVGRRCWMCVWVLAAVSVGGRGCGCCFVGFAQLAGLGFGVDMHIVGVRGSSASCLVGVG